MQKKLTVLFAFAIFVLLGFALSPTPAFAKPPCKGEDRHTLDCGGFGGGAGGQTEIALCITLNTASELGAMGGITDLMPFDMFCDDAGLDAAIADGRLGIGLRPPEARVQLDFMGCVDLDPDCVQRDFVELVMGGEVGVTSTGLAGVSFNTGNAFDNGDVDFANLPIGESAPTKLVVAFTFFNSLIESPKQSRRTINYGTRLNDCFSDQVTVRRLTDDCWEVESLPTEQACLILDSGKGNNPKTELQGTYHMPFKMTLARFGDSFNENGEPNQLAENCLPLPPQP